MTATCSYSGHPGPNSPTRLRRNRLLGLLVIGLILLVTCLANMSLGAREIPLREVWETLPQLPTLVEHPETAHADEQVISELRLPRTVLGLVVGSALGVAGTLIQGHTRNPLADPGMIGISAGAALAVVTAFSFFGVSSISLTAIIAFAGAILATAAVFGLATLGRGTLNPITLILGGAAITAVLTSITSALVLLDEQNLDRMRFWTVGSLTGRDLTIFWGVLPFIALGLILALATAPTVNVLNLGQEAATALGVNTHQARIFGMFLIALLAGAATAAAGSIGFIGLVIPHISRALCGSDYRWIVPYSALIGPIILLSADIVGRFVARPGEVQVGIILALVGAPFFMYLIYRNKVVTL
ncbi:iron chelate uptake ABC transporter family permease subunit [Corynebacterium sp. 3HC-13]|uniref:FecCD family ABC transporter permease n=1 Tax=Corynebacterium poyangense TaxID=2684405 RepID=UPI001CCF39C3|nr:iron ABC transporter permease [Corynebacterium poyangense]MBZ8176735.1 iron chelate uptake ABC transporter family permease subunit [Corynebacterium poyangense]